MALRDYVICGECKTKIIYDGHDNGRDRLEEVWGDPNADVWTVHLLCPDCIKKLHADLAALRALLNEAQGFIPTDTGWDYTTDAGGYLYDRIDAALAKGKA